MPSDKTPNIQLPYIYTNQAQKEVNVNEAFTILDAVWNNGVVTKSLATPPSSPAENDAYIISTSPTGAWAGKEKYVAYYNNGWRFIEPREGITLWVNDENILYTFNGTDWMATIASVSTVNGLSGNVTLTTSNIGEGANLYFTNTRARDAVGGILSSEFTYTGTSISASAIPSTKITGTKTSAYISDFSASADARINLQKAAANGLATLDSSSKIPTSQLPAIAITDTFVLGSEEEMLSIGAETGDIVVRTDLNKTFILKGENPGDVGNWQELITPTGSVLSVNGQTGAVVLTTANITEGDNLYFTDERAQDAALAVISADNGISYTYNDAANTASISPTYGTVANTICQGNDSRLSDSRAPAGSAGGDLGGNYPNPTINFDAVTFAKMQNISSGKILGRSTASTGDIEELTPNTNLAISAGNLNVTAAGSTNQVQYNNAGSLGGAASVSIDSNGVLNLKDDPTLTTPANGVVLYSKANTGRRFLTLKEVMGDVYRVQPFMGERVVRYWVPNGAGTTTQYNQGITLSFTGSGGGRALSTTSYYTTRSRLANNTGTTANSSAAGRHNGLIVHRGAASGQGGFYWVAECGRGDTTLVTDARWFMGLYGTNSAISGVEPSALANMIGFGRDSTDTNLQFMHNDASGTASKVNLGLNFPANTKDTDWYKFEIYSPPNGSSIYYLVTRMNTGDQASGSVSTDIPANSIFLAPQGYINNTATSGVAALEYGMQYLEAYN